jgi:tetratricopeptide (TPR) repeat protein
MPTLASPNSTAPLRNYDQAIRRNPNDGLAFNNRGNAYARRANPTAQFRTTTIPNSALAILNRGEAHGRRGQPDRAIEDYDQAIRRNPNYAEVFLNRGLAKRANGDSAGGDADIAKANRLNPNERN